MMPYNAESTSIFNRSAQDSLLSESNQTVVPMAYENTEEFKQWEKNMKARYAEEYKLRAAEVEKKARQEGTEELAMKQIARAVKNKKDKNTFLQDLIEDTGFSKEELEAIWNKYDK